MAKSTPNPYQRFSIGDRVVANRDIGAQKKGALGIIMAYRGLLGVMWDIKDSIQHSLDGDCPNGYGWWADETDLSNLGSTFGASGITIGGMKGKPEKEVMDTLVAAAKRAQSGSIYSSTSSSRIIAPIHFGSSTASSSLMSRMATGSAGSVGPGWTTGFYDEVQETKPKPKKKVVKFDIAHLEALVIDDTTKQEIVSVLKQSKNSDKLFNDWGLGEVIEYGKGMTFMFYGPPGTGKTWAATCIAKVLGTGLLTIGQAEIQTSEPGGANRAIQEAFATAKAENKVLFIDECDSLITSRTGLGMVLAGEVNTLLTEIEKFEGVCILATNRIEQMDAALERRISLIAKFDNPGVEERIKIWTRLLPPKMPLGEGVTAEALAKHELSGGQIKNVVLAAARLALAEEADKVSLEHFDRAVKRTLSSKDIMGHSNYEQAIQMHHDHVHRDVTVTKSKGKKSAFKDFLVDEATDNV